ncbi:ATP-binding cassette domain-containing protein [Bacillus sp. EAC]|uniref:ABC transporter ATP-binding protein n=1 Tax=Bacillus sp. EAC TaxID=1978338 RepID=UPI000B44283A|nr:ATP-binding cassette domain-containing protein [Bacillus sp. EAC]
MIEVTNLKKNYRILKRDPGLRGFFKALFKPVYEIKTAVNDINFHIKEGEIVGYIGSNGAGKSTTIKMISGVLTPDEGNITVNGIVPYKDRMSNAYSIGAVFGQRTQLYWDIPVQESFDLLKHVYEIKEEDFQKNLTLFKDILDLEPLLPIPVRQLSLGQKMRCELAAAFLHNPKIVYLDEPTIGLDVVVKEKIRQFIKDMNQLYKTTIILTTHDMQDIEELCHRIMVIDHGTIMYDGQLNDLKNSVKYNRMIQIEIEKQQEFQLPPKLSDKLFAEKVEGKNNSFVLSYNNAQLSSTDIIQEIMSRYSVLDFTITEPGIEVIVKEMYERGASSWSNIGS